MDFEEIVEAFSEIELLITQAKKENVGPVEKLNKARTLAYESWKKLKEEGLQIKQKV